MSLVEYLSTEIEKLPKNEKQELTKKLLENMDGNEIRVLMEKIKDSKELAGMLKVAEPAFADWDNEEDKIYDNL